jgi:hypothetical protein
MFFMPERNGDPLNEYYKFITVEIYTVFVIFIPQILSQKYYSFNKITTGIFKFACCQGLFITIIIFPINNVCDQLESNWTQAVVV